MLDYVFYFYLVRAIKFPMLPKHHHVSGNDLVYELPIYALDGIRFVLVVLFMLMIDLNLLEVELSNGFWET
jgi:hypothetical protein